MRLRKWNVYAAGHRVGMIRAANKIEASRLIRKMSSTLGRQRDPLDWAKGDYVVRRSDRERRT